MSETWCQRYLGGGAFLIRYVPPKPPKRRRRVVRKIRRKSRD